MKIKRDAFLYLDGKDARFAQCGSCVFGYQMCSLMNDRKVSAELGSCGVYIRGGPDVLHPLANMTREQLGYVERKVRCENCKFYGASHCNLFAQLNRDLGALFDLDEKVSRYGCCNANTPG